MAGFLVAAILTAYLAFTVVRNVVYSLRSETGTPEIAEGQAFTTPQDIANLIDIMVEKTEEGLVFKDFDQDEITQAALVRKAEA